MLITSLITRDEGTEVITKEREQNECCVDRKQSKFKAIIAAGDVPTIVDPTPYKTRFQEAIRKYFITTS